MVEETTPEPTELEKATKVLNDIKEERAKLETLKANEMLASSAGGHIEPTPEPEPISNVEYADKLKRGEVNPLKEDGISIN